MFNIDQFWKAIAAFRYLLTYIFAKDAVLFTLAKYPTDRNSQPCPCQWTEYYCDCSRL